MSNVRVLIVDDEALARERVRRLLQAEPDIEIVGEAANGREAVEKVRELHPDIVCLDVQMPEMDGFEVARNIAERWPERRDRPWIIAITANTAHGTTSQSLRTFMPRRCDAYRAAARPGLRFRSCPRAGA